jgi:hypothetical protein
MIRAKKICRIKSASLYLTPNRRKTNANNAPPERHGDHSQSERNKKPHEVCRVHPREQIAIERRGHGKRIVVRELPIGFRLDEVRAEPQCVTRATPL